VSSVANAAATTSKNVPFLRKALSFIVYRPPSTGEIRCRIESPRLAGGK
jgi:hypothetical protein